MKTYIYSLVVSAIFLIAGHANAADYFVSPTGSGNGTSWSTPANGIAFLNGAGTNHINNIPSGSTVYMLEGTYSKNGGGGPVFWGATNDNITIKGGYPAASNTTGTTPTGYDPLTHPAVIDFNGPSAYGSGFWQFTNGAARSLRLTGITFTSSISNGSKIIGGGSSNGVQGNLVLTDVAVSNLTVAIDMTTNMGGGALTITNSIFSNNTRAVRTGVLTTITGSTFTNNTTASTTFGGPALLLENLGTTTITNSNFCGNTYTAATGGTFTGGGAISNSGTNVGSNTLLRVIGCNFYNNSSGNGGGAIGLYGASLFADGCNFLNNSSTSGAKGGGAIAVMANAGYGVGMTVQNSIFYQNSAPSNNAVGPYNSGTSLFEEGGGAILINGFGPASDGPSSGFVGSKILNNKFVQNSVGTGSAGGAITLYNNDGQFGNANGAWSGYATTTRTATLTGNTFYGNYIGSSGNTTVKGSDIIAVAQAGGQFIINGGNKMQLPAQSNYIHYAYYAPMGFTDPNPNTGYAFSGTNSFNNSTDDGGVGAASYTCALTIQPVVLNVSGFVYNDANGGATVGGTGTNAGGALQVNLVNSSGVVVQSVAVAADGSYSGISYPLDGSAYKIVLSTAAGSAVPSLPVNAANPWINTAESTAGNTAAQSATLGQIELPTSFATPVLANQNFGIEQKPAANAVSGNYTNPGGIVTMQAPTLTGSDPEDGVYLGTGLTDNILIQSLPSGGTLYYGMVPLSIGDVISGYDPSELRFDPPDGAGTYQFTFSEIDAAGIAGIPGTATMVFSLPFDVKPDFGVTNPGIPLTGNLNTNDDVPPGSTYGTPTPNPGNPAACLPVVSANGTYTFTCTTPGTYTFDIPVCPNGVTAPNVACHNNPLTITVLDPSLSTNPPVANPDLAIVEGNGPGGTNSVTIPVKANDGPGNTGGTLGTPTVTIVPGNGTATVNPDGTIKYQPNPGFIGIDTFRYQVCESPSGICRTASVTVTVTDPGNPMINITEASDDYAKGQMGTTLTVAAANGVLVNDRNNNGNTLSVAAQTTTVPGKGTLVLASDGSYTFTPVTGFSGPVNFGYKVCDGSTPPACDSATLHLLIMPVPDLTPTLDMDDLNFTTAGTPRDFVVTIYNIGVAGTNANNMIIRIPKLSAFTITYNIASGTSNVFGGTDNENSNWIFTQNASFITITAKPGTNIAAGGQAILGFSISRNAGIPPNTTQNITPTIFPGAGGELKTDNNNTVTSISTN